MKNIYDRAETPWESKAAWQTANRDLGYLIHRHRDALKHTVMLAQNIEASLESIFILLDDLCRVTCPWCPTPCCLSADVWIDFKDLVFLHLTGHPIPDKQLRSHLNKVCRCWRPKGCALPRISRPWICTWYLCPTQKAILLRKSCDIRDKFSRQIQTVKDCRREMEAEFIRVVS